MIAAGVVAALIAAAPGPPPITPDQGLGGQTYVRSGFKDAEATAGPLEGRWRLTDRHGRPLYVFQLSDPGGQPDPRASNPDMPTAEGAWRDLRRPHGLNASGVLLAVNLEKNDLVLMFYDGPPPSAQIIVLHRVAPGRWIGRLDGAGVVLAPD